ncbi:NAD-dependent epimerase/dehydratase family protein [Anaerotignum sp.]|uniref:NAD-dependent epimerase/dehydratase family protein n=1 Tax=Anaerotignum sp. TaxID=2039241 RepID=UPI002714A1E8|nr:epimerase [Anaerotignum sp.]
MQTVEELENKLSEPSDRLVEDVAKIKGDIMILGLGGKMGPSLAKLLKRSIEQAGVSKRVMGASRFSNETIYKELTEFGIECYKVDLLNDAALNDLPDAENIIYMAGNKFGTAGNEHFTWAMNAYLPGRVAEKYKNSNIVVFSTGNIYPFMPIESGGATESVRPSPIGEYAQSCLGRERVFEHFAIKNGTKMLLYRLNYALDLRYGVLLEIAKKVISQKPIDLSMGHVNVIWQGDANEYAIRSLLHCECPAKKLNITGLETISVQWLAEQFGEHFGKMPIFENRPAETALLNAASHSFELFGNPFVVLNDMILMTVEWVKAGGQEISKRTHFQERKGDF